jgi:diguanylate cyclase (GGDEF)-like protein/PAS domain S-box-containing protein
MAKPPPIVAAEQALTRLLQQWLAAEISLSQLTGGTPGEGGESGLRLGSSPSQVFQRRLFQQIFAASPVGMAVVEATTCRIVVANPALGQMLGYTPQELTQLTLIDVILPDADPPPSGPTFAQEGLGANPLQPLPFRCSMPLGISLEYCCQSKLGHRVWVNLSLSKLQEGTAASPAVDTPAVPTEAEETLDLTLATLEDITQRKQTEMALAVRETRYRTLVSNLPGAVYRMRQCSAAESGVPSWTVAFISEGIVDILGFSASALVGPTALSYEHLVHPEDRHRVKREMADAVAHQVPFRLEYRCLSKSGQYRWVLDQGQVGWDDQQRCLDGVLIDITDLKTTEAQLAYRTSHDTLTGLPNRALFLNHLDRSLQTDGTGSYPALAVLMIDIDNFKQINDCIGHGIGDQLLIEVATRLRACLRADDFVARLGGDEFGVQVNGVTRLVEITQLADTIHRAMQQPVILGEHSLMVSVSIGITLQGPGSMVIYYQAQDMLRDAEIAMYRAKQQGRSEFALYDTSMHQRAIERLELETALRNACSRNELVAYYQPIVHLDTMALAGFEVLVRWQHPTKGLVPPDQFIPVAEEMGLILAIDDQVMALACQQLAQWQRDIPQMPPIFLSLNLSTRHFTRPDLVTYITQVLDANGLQPHHIKLEVTESALMDKSDIPHQTLQTLSQMGFGLSLDDFGTGYSSLSYIHQYPMRTLKIDRSFIMNLHQRPESSQIVGAITAMAASLNLDVVAEGIETQAHVDYLKQLHCQYGQGYWFAKPLPAREAESWLHQACRLGTAPAPNPRATA